MKEQWGQALIFNSVAIFNIKYNDKDLQDIHTNFEIIWEKLWRLNHNRFFNDGELAGVIKFLRPNIDLIKRHCLINEQIKELMIELFDAVAYEIILVAEDYEKFELCRNIERITAIILSEITEKI